MSITSVGKVCLFSQISGVIKIDGKPAKDATLIRTANRARERTDKTTTDDQGYFEFPPVFKPTVTKYLPQEFAASQQIQVLYGDKEYKIWEGVKRSPHENSEARGAPLIVECELNAPINRVWIDGAPFSTLCTWDVVPDATYDWSRQPEDPEASPEKEEEIEFFDPTKKLD